MIQRVYERASLCAQLSDIFVATDDERISACVKAFGGNVIITDSALRSGTDRIAKAASALGLDHNDIIINIQGDQPIFDPDVVSQLVRPFENENDIVMTTLRCRISDKSDINNPNHVKVVTDSKGFAIYFSRYPIPYLRDNDTTVDHYKHLGFYGFRLNFLIKYTNLPEGLLEAAEKLEQLRAVENGFKIRVVETSSDSVEVDVPEDVMKVEAIISMQSGL